MRTLLIAILTLLSLTAVRCQDYDIPATVFAIEFGMDAIVCSATLPNETTIGLARVAGDSQYLSLMRQHFNLSSEAVNDGSTSPEYTLLPAGSPAIVHRRPDKYWKDWLFVKVLRRSLEIPNDSGVVTKYAHDSDVLIFKRMVTKAAEASYRALSSRYGMEVTDHHPFTVITYPTSVFTVFQQIEPLQEPIPTWQRLDWRPISNHGSTVALMRKMSRAVYEAGFRHTISTSPWSIAYNHDTLAYTMPAATWSICVNDGAAICYPFYLSGTKLKDLDPCTHPESIAIVLDLTSHSLSVWPEDLNKCCLNWVPWSTYTMLELPELSRGYEIWAEGVRVAIEDIMQQAWRTPINDSTIRVISIGQAWHRDALSVLKQKLEHANLNLTLLDDEPGDHVTSMGLAGYARRVDPYFTTPIAEIWALDGSTDHATLSENGQHDEL